MKKKSIKDIRDIDVKGKRVFIRVDFNVPLNDAGEIRDDTRIRTSLPTLQYLVENGAKILCASHLGRPGGKKKPGLTLKPAAQRLSQLLNKEILFPGEIIGSKIDTAKTNLKEGDILLLQNLRFHPGETENDPDFAAQLAKNIDIYINDAFGVSHRDHASVQAITRFVPIRAAGLLLKKEIQFLSMAIENTPENYTVILGGVKVSEKIPLINNLMNKAKKILLGGSLAYSFLRASGVDVGGSKTEKGSLQVCKDILKKAKEKNIKLLLPVDHIAAHSIEPEVTIRMIKKGEDIPEEMMGLDIGFETIELYTQELKDAELIVWNGPLGVFELETFSAGTASSIIGGGHSVAAINKAGVADEITHLSTGGVASLKFLAGETLPGIEALLEA